MSVKDQLNEYIKDAKDDAEREALTKEFFINSAKRYAESVRELSDEALDSVVAGNYTIGKVFECEDYKNQCMAIYKNDFCTAFLC